MLSRRLTSAAFTCPRSVLARISNLLQRSQSRGSNPHPLMAKPDSLRRRTSSQNQQTSYHCFFQDCCYCRSSATPHTRLHQPMHMVLQHVHTWLVVHVHIAPPTLFMCWLHDWISCSHADTWGGSSMHAACFDRFSEP